LSTVRLSVPASEATRFAGHVGSEDAAAPRLGGALVQPAFDDEREPAVAEPDHHAQRDPGGRLLQHQQQQRGGAAQRRQCREGADVADIGDQTAHREAGQHEAERPARRQQPDMGHRGAVELQADRQQHALQVGAEHQEHDAGQQRRDREQLGVHLRLPAALHHRPELVHLALRAGVVIRRIVLQAPGQSTTAIRQGQAPPLGAEGSLLQARRLWRGEQFCGRPQWRSKQR